MPVFLDFFFFLRGPLFETFALFPPKYPFKQKEPKETPKNACQSIAFLSLS